MSQSISHSHFDASHLPAVRPTRTPYGQPRRFWCDLKDSPWSKTMRSQIAAAALVSGPGASRTWRFYSRIETGE
jgi:hypothetical protein